MYRDKLRVTWFVVAAVALALPLTTGLRSLSRAVPGAGQASVPSDLPDVADVLATDPVREHAGVRLSSGYGSALSVDPTHPGTFFLLCDRGPNVDTTEDHIAFLFPGFAPHIGRFQLDGGSLKQTASIDLRDADGRPLTGLPREPGLGGTGEVPEADAGKVLAFDPEGIDPEGLVAVADGSFWISEEYGPSLLHVDARGRTVEAIDPYGQGRALPKVLRHRWPNRGMEGLCVTPDGRTLVGVMESPLDNPSQEVRKTSRAVRLLCFDIRSGATRQYLYLLDEPGIGLSDIATLGGTSFLVIERDKKRPADAEKPSRVKRVYRIDMATASDVTDPEDGADGLLVGGKTLEAASEDELRTAGIQPVTKTLVVDLLTAAKPYPHDKPEGLVLLGDRILAISNDDDFGVDDDGKGGVVPKLLPAAANSVDRARVYFIRLQQPLL